MLESILYVEDEEVTAQMIGEILDNCCQNLYFAPNGKIAYEIFLNKKIDLVITDINMPVMDGLELIEKIREKDKNIKIACTTGYCEKELEQSLLDFNIYKNLKKPIDIGELIDCTKFDVQAK